MLKFTPSGWGYERSRMEKNFKKRLEQLFEPRGTMAEVSRITGIPKNTLFNWKSPTRDSVPSVIEASKVAKALNISLEYLLSGEDSQKQYKQYDELTQQIIDLVKDQPNDTKIELRGIIKHFIQEYSNQHYDRRAGGGTV